MAIPLATKACEKKEVQQEIPNFFTFEKVEQESKTGKIPR